MKITKDNSGFTIPELIIVITVTGIISSLLLIFMVNIFSTTAGLESDVSSFSDRLTASDFLREELGKSSGLISQNSIADINVGNPEVSGDPYWKVLQPNPDIAIVTGSQGTITPVIYYKKFSQDSSLNYIKNGTIYYEDEYIMYMDNSDKKLYVRTLANPSAQASGSTVRSTCPPSIASATCPADRIVLENVQDVTPGYYSKSGNKIDFYSSVDPITGEYNGPSYPLAEVVELDIHVQKQENYNRTLDNNTLVRVALRNI